MDLVLFARPELIDQEQLLQLKMKCLIDRHTIVKEFMNGEARADVLKAVYARAQGLVVPSLEHISSDAPFLSALKELKSRNKCFIAIFDGIDTTTIQGEAAWNALLAIANAARKRHDLYKEERVKADTATRAIKRRVRIEQKKYEPRFHITLKQAWDDYRANRVLTVHTLRSYKSLLRSIFHDWMCRPIESITKAEIEERFTTVSGKNGKCTANYAFRLMRALFNYAQVKYEDSSGKRLIERNPVSRLSELRIWHKEVPRERCLEFGQMSAWYQTVTHLRSDNARDFLRFLLLTGARRSEGAKLKWTNVDLIGGTMVFESTKNHRNHRLPICRHLLDILKTRREQYPDAIFVFGKTGKAPYILPECIKLKVEKQSGVRFCPHDLRRTYASTADAIRIERPVIKRLLNHVDRDVTERYIRSHPERFRPEVEAIAQTILKYCGVDNRPQPQTVEVIDVEPILRLTVGE